jgi:hypothetical protein
MGRFWGFEGAETPMAMKTKSKKLAMKMIPDCVGVARMILEKVMR